MTQHLGTQRKEFYSRNKVSLKLIPSADMATEYEVSDVRGSERERKRERQGTVQNPSHGGNKKAHCIRLAFRPLRVLVHPFPQIKELQNTTGSITRAVIHTLVPQYGVRIAHAQVCWRVLCQFGTRQSHMRGRNPNGNVPP